MRDKILYGLGVFAILILINDIIHIMGLPDEVNQGAIFKIIFFHVPVAITALTASAVALVASVLFLVTKNFVYDALAVAVTEVGLAFLAANLVTGSLWGRVIWGSVLGLGCAPDFGPGLLAAVRRLPDAAPRHRRTHPARYLRRGVFHFRFHRRAHRDLLHQMVAHTASAARILGRREFSVGLAAILPVEHGGHADDWNRIHHDPAAAGGIAARTRLSAPPGAFHVRQSK